MATDAESKKLSDLRVVDLRAELEKRGLDKTGVKAALLERLQKVLCTIYLITLIFGLYILNC